MFRELSRVAEFHKKHKFPVGLGIGQDHKTDLVRAHLIGEEFGEYLLAIANKDVVLAADALGDLIYVVMGAAVTYGIPLKQVFDEIHKSNMTKAVRDPDDTRLRNKGESYVPANIPAALVKGAERRPEVICLCGSTRFKKEFEEANRRLTAAGQIVLSVGWFGHADGMDQDSDLKQKLDELHKRKIDISDDVFVLNVGGYIGSSTKSEIEYARTNGVPVHYLEELK